VGFGQWLVSAGIWFVIVGLPILLIAALIGFGAYRLFRRFRPLRTKTGEAPAGSDSGT
jgi:hypothetical protein